MNALDDACHVHLDRLHDPRRPDCVLDRQYFVTMGQEVICGKMLKKDYEDVGSRCRREAEEKEKRSAARRRPGWNASAP